GAQPAKRIRQSHYAKRFYELRFRQTLTQLARAALYLLWSIPNGVARKSNQRGRLRVQPGTAQMSKNLRCFLTSQSFGFENLANLPAGTVTSNPASDDCKHQCFAAVIQDRGRPQVFNCRGKHGT